MGNFRLWNGQSFFKETSYRWKTTTVHNDLTIFPLFQTVNCRYTCAKTIVSKLLSAAACLTRPKSRYLCVRGVLFYRPLSFYWHQHFDTFAICRRHRRHTHKIESKATKKSHDGGKLLLMHVTCRCSLVAFATASWMLLAANVVIVFIAWSYWYESPSCSIHLHGIVTSLQPLLAVFRARIDWRGFMCFVLTIAWRCFAFILEQLVGTFVVARNNAPWKANSTQENFVLLASIFVECVFFSGLP